MTTDDDDRTVDDGVFRSDPNKRRKQILAGAVGLAAVLGGGAYVVTSQLAARDDTSVVRDAGALAPVVPESPEPVESSPSPVPAPSTSASAASSEKPAEPTKAAATTKPSPTKDKATVRKEIDAARAAAASDGFPVQRPLTAKKPVPAEAISTRTETTGEGTIRITTAKADLSGQSTQLLAADDGMAVGDARCTQKIRFTESACLLYTSPSPRDQRGSRMPSSA